MLAKDLVKNQVEQALQFHPDVVLDEQVQEVIRTEDHFEMRCVHGTYLTRSIVIAGGKGAFEPMPLKCPGYEEFMHRGVEYSVRDPEAFRDKNVVVVGGGDTALDFVLMLKGVAKTMALVHRRDGWRAHAASVHQLERAAAVGDVDLLTFHEVREIHGTDVVETITIFDNRTDDDVSLACDCVLSCLGFKPDLGPIKAWGVEVEKNRIKVDQLMATNLAGVFAAGDVVDYPGKLDLIATGYSEAAIAVNNAVHYVDPSARVNPGHSTNMKIFKE